VSLFSNFFAREAFFTSGHIARPGAQRARLFKMKSIFYLRGNSRHDPRELAAQQRCFVFFLRLSFSAEPGLGRLL
jgi:hypothetical protein